MPHAPKQHDADRTRARTREYERDRADVKAFYSGTAWRRARDRVLSREPFCRICAAAGRVMTATQVDHIVPMRLSRGAELDEENLQPLCTACHARKTRHEERTQ